ncbi:polysaccharide pyruvyl transferase family protein [Vallitalea guaymasensis]|uniref:Polysaccharide pyruvyl transferase family protein n=1 Tax=Vallitalea guaymasensis TaxID=1185412 RepID=A0A8J8M9U2_9FIRM|nr:polysaccharide pyruvyl transferase family protein [Vallitalea guaymasensis]QUH28971.1 polysaccharide pyruvyl transferase family protein [Vallitalea guaymasensis]
MRYANLDHFRGNVYTFKKGIKSERVINIGDYMQILAVDNLYRHMGINEEEIIRIEYYDLESYDGEYVILPLNFILFNSDYGKRQLRFSPKIIPVFIGISCISLNFSQEELNYLRQYAPIGCRDEYTLNLFRQVNIPAYLNGCLTATFPKREFDPKKMNKVFLVDIPKSLYNYIPTDLLNNVEYLTHQYYGNIDNSIEGMKIDEFTKNRLNKYKEEAALVVTSRLHCASPCMAMGIPVIFVKDKFSYTFSWIEKLIDFKSEQEYEEINWNPASINYEDMKKCILETSAKRIKETYNKYNELYMISSFYENRDKKEYVLFYTENIKKHADKYWNKKENIKYAFWGVTQITDLVYDYILKNFPNAQLVAIFDKYRDINFHGLISERLDQIDNYNEVCIIATGNSSCIEARELFKNSRNQKYYCLCFGNKYKII